MKTTRVTLPALLAAIACASSAGAQTPPSPSVVVSPDHQDGIYHVGETVKWTAEWVKAGAEPPASAKFVLKSGGQKEVGGGELKFDGTVAHFESKFDGPNTVLAVVSWGDGPASQAVGGAVADPFAIKPAVPEEPADFAAFWKEKVAAIKKVPPNAVLTPQDSGKPGVKYEKVTLDGYDGSHVQGQIAVPDRPGKFPAIFQPQYAGVYALQKPWVTGMAGGGWLMLNIEAHDIPVDNPMDYYTKAYGPGGALQNYWKIGNTDKNTSYYLRMYLSCVQAIEYLKTRPEWDGKTIVVMGVSQGGQQTLVTAGLCPDDVTAACAFLPAACDNWAESIGRHSGFPFWWNQVDNRDAAAVRETSKYFDPVYFARRIKCPTLCGVALRDDLAPPSSVFAAYNQITSPKDIVILANAAHQDENGSQQPYQKLLYGTWLPAIAQGKAPPTK